jgi:hypothetical protein
MKMAFNSRYDAYVAKYTPVRELRLKKLSLVILKAFVKKKR